VNNTEKEILVEQGPAKAGLKRKKLNNNDYVEKVLMDFGYQEDEKLSKIEIECHRRSLAITDERIVIKLKDPKAPLERDLGPKPDFVRPTSVKKPKETTPPSDKEYPAISITCSEEDPNSNKENIDSNVKSDITFRNSNGSIKFYSNNVLDFLVKSNSKQQNLLKPVLQKSDAKSISDLRSPFGQLNLAPTNKEKSKTKSKKKSNPLRKSLLPDFEVASRRESDIDEVKLPSEDKDCNKELEELLQTLTMKQKESKAKSLYPVKEKEVAPTTSTSQNVSTTDNSGVVGSSLSNQIHNILFSKTGNFNDFNDSDEDEDYDPVDEKDDDGSDNDIFKSFKDDEEELDPIIKGDDYDLTDYSDNSSSNNGSYSFHEEIESFPEQPKMFQLFNHFQLNLQDPCSQCNVFNFENSQGHCQHDSQSLFRTDSQLFPRTSGESNNSQTIFHDYQYYLKHQPGNNLLDPTYDHQRERKLSKLNDSPIKVSYKIKRVYCNDKPIPLWAGDLKTVERISKEQKKIFDPLQIFGRFNVDNLNLVEVFNKNEPRFRQPR